MTKHSAQAVAAATRKASKRREAVALALRIGVEAAAAELGLSKRSLYRWTAEARDAKQQPRPKRPPAPKPKTAGAPPANVGAPPCPPSAPHPAPPCPAPGDEEDPAFWTAARRRLLAQTARTLEALLERAAECQGVPPKGLLSEVTNAAQTLGELELGERALLGDVVPEAEAAADPPEASPATPPPAAPPPPGSGDEWGLH